MRHGYSCPTCNEWFYTADKVGDRLPCPICDGTLRYRGRVERDRRVTFDAEMPACDGQCTSARGVSCECRCGGKNHGSGRVIVVTVTEGVATVNLDRPELLERLRASRAPQLAEAAAIDEQVSAAIEARYGDVRRARSERWLSPAEFAEYLRYWDAARAQRKANAYKVPSRRVAALRALLAELSAVAA